MEADAQLEMRLSLLQSSGQVDGQIVAFVRRAAPALAEAAGQPLTDATFGSLITHTLLALQRVRTGQAVTEWDTDHSEELAAFPEALAAGEAFAESARAELGLDLPPQERQFVALHVAAIRQGGA